VRICFMHTSSALEHDPLQIELRNIATKAASLSKPIGSCISISDAGGKRQPPSGKSFCINLTELNDEDRHQSNVR
jgi:hypothetical protein